MGSAVLLTFAFSALVVESCQKATAQNPNPTIPIATTTTVGGIIVGNGLQIDASTGRLSANVQSATPVNKLVYMKTSGGTNTLHVADYNGANGYTIPTGALILQDGGTSLSPDGLLVFFSAKVSSTSTPNLYKCSTESGSPILIITGTPGTTALNVGSAQ